MDGRVEGIRTFANNRPHHLFLTSYHTGIRWGFIFEWGHIYMSQLWYEVTAVGSALGSRGICRRRAGGGGGGI